jgi:hypothetical protein
MFVCRFLHNILKPKRHIQDVVPINPAFVGIGYDFPQILIEIDQFFTLCKAELTFLTADRCIPEWQ